MASNRAAAGAAIAFLVLLAASVLPLDPGAAKVHLLEALAGAAALALALASGLGRPPAGAVVPLGLLAAWLTAGVGWAPDRHAAATAWLWCLALALVCAAALRFGRRCLVGLQGLVLGVALPLLTHGLLQQAGVLQRDGWANPTRLSGTFVNSNTYGVFAGATLLVAAGVALTPTAGASPRLAAALCAPLALASLILTASRGAWSATGAGLAAFLATTILAGRLRRPRAWLAALVLAACLAGVGIAVQAGLGGVRTRLADAGLYSLGHRWAIWQGTLEMLRVRPLGVGLGGFAALFPRFRAHDDRFLINFAHSEVLEALATWGVPGVALGALAGVRLLRRQEVREAWFEPPARGALAALAALATASLYDFPLHKTSLSLIAASLLGAIAGGAEGRPAARRTLGAAAALLLLGAGACLGHGERLRARAEELESRGAFPRAEQHYHQADSWLFPPSASLARSAGEMNLSLARLPRAASVFLERARSWLELAIARAPADADAHLALALAQEASASATQALLHYQQATELAPRDGIVALAAADFFERQGDLAAAARLRARALGRVVDRAPWRRRSAAVAETVARAGLPAEVVAAEPPVRPPLATDLARELDRRGQRLAARLVRARAEPRFAVAP